MPQNTPKPTDLSPVLAAVSAEEAIAFFAQKGFKIGFDYRDVWQQEHQAGFTVAKAMQLDVLQDIKAAVDAAIINGTTLAEFQKTLTPLLQSKGWWGKKEQTDPLTGEVAVAQLGSPARLELIYDTNLATAYSEGQWERIQRSKELFPFLEYVRSASVNPRHTHLAYAGLVLPADDAFWQSHLPIKEYKCKCSVVQHTRRMLEREGLVVGKAPPEVMRTVVNKRTGESMQVPVGVDPAFHYPPGGRRAHLDKMLVDKQVAANIKVGARPAAAAALAARGQQAAQAAGQMKDVAGKKVVHNMGPVSGVSRILAATGFDLTGYSSIFDNSSVRHTLNNHDNAKKEAARGQMPLTVDDWRRLPGILDAYDDVFADGTTRQGLKALVYTKLIDGEGYWLVMELRSPKSKLQAQVSMRKKIGAWTKADKQSRSGN